MDIPEAIFLAEIILLLVCASLLGDATQRIGQPADMGQLIAGILLGPSVSDESINAGF
jgi:Kef-type K+ transport system membrane component KefB